jgi:hypothetical protein
MSEPRYFIDGAGYAWRDFGPDGISMARINPDNSPIPEPRTYLEPVFRHVAASVTPTKSGGLIVACSCLASVFGSTYDEAAENHLRHLEMCAGLSVAAVGLNGMSDDTRYECCDHCCNVDGGPYRGLNTPCAVQGCPGSVPVGPTKEGKQ